MHKFWGQSYKQGFSTFVKTHLFSAISYGVISWFFSIYNDRRALGSSPAHPVVLSTHKTRMISIKPRSDLAGMPTALTACRFTLDVSGRTGRWVEAPMDAPWRKGSQGILGYVVIGWDPPFMAAMNGRGPTTRALGNLLSILLITYAKSWIPSSKYWT